MLETPGSAQTMAMRGKVIIEAFVDWIFPFIAAIAVFMIFLSGLRLIMAFGNEEVIKKEQPLFFWVGFGLVMIAVSKILINAVYQPQGAGDIEVFQPGSSTEVASVIRTILSIVNWVLAIVGVVAFAGVVYAGFLILLQWGDEENVGKAKKILFNSIIGLVIIVSSYAITQTIISKSSFY